MTSPDAPDGRDRPHGPAPAPEHVAVLRAHDGWRVFTGGDCARYPTREDAETAAQAACDQARACGRAVRLTTHQPNGELRTVVVF